MLTVKKTRNYLNRNFNRERKPDTLTKRRRSSLMSKIRSRGTKFERDFIFDLKRETRCKFITNDNDTVGKPDLVFPSRRICVFLDSDFWHGWQYPRWKHLLKNNFWREKINKNRKRDRRNTRRLRAQGWLVVRIWEHDIKKSPNESLRKVLNAL